MKKIILIICVSIFLMITYTISAQSSPEKRAKMKELNKEIKKYQQENMLPLIQEQRKKLDYLLSNDDKKTIAEIRLLNKEMRYQSKGDIQKIKIEKKENEKKNYKNFKQKMKTIVDNNQTIISESFSPIQAQQEKWKTDLKNIRNKYLIENEEGRNHFHKNRELRSFLMERNKRTDINFLLFDYLQDATENPKATNNKVANSLNIYPNPIKSTSNISYELNKTSSVTILVLNNKSETIKVLLKDEKLNGQQKHEFDLSDLEKGDYFYQIIVNKEIINKKIVKE